MLGALLRAILPDKPAPLTTRPIAQTNEPEEANRGDGLAFHSACPLLGLEPEEGFPAMVRGRLAL